jgi:hypothetical protein
MVRMKSGESGNSTAPGYGKSVGGPPERVAFSLHPLHVSHRAPWKDGGMTRPEKAAKSAMAVSLALTVWSSVALAQPVRWKTYTIPATTTSVDFPASIFTEEAGRPDGHGQRFRTSDGRADLTIQAAPNISNDSPAVFLAKKNPPSGIQYKRVTSRFFAVSSYKGDRVFYDRCNFSGRMVHCVLINYPASEERDWDGIVTRISLSLRGG